MEMMIVGIDPGLTGAVAYMHGTGTLHHVVDTPSFLMDGRRREYDVPSMIRLLLLNGQTGHIHHVFIEQQQMRPGVAVQSTAKVWFGYGLWIGILSALHVPYTAVAPQVWQREMYAGAVGTGKERSLLVASRLWPDFVISKDRHDRADALLIAEWGRRALSGHLRDDQWEELA